MCGLNFAILFGHMGLIALLILNFSLAFAEPPQVATTYTDPTVISKSVADSLAAKSDCKCQREFGKALGAPDGSPLTLMQIEALQNISSVTAEAMKRMKISPQKDDDSVAIAASLHKSLFKARAIESDDGTSHMGLRIKKKNSFMLEGEIKF